jgi:hypothetical protein
MAASPAITSSAQLLVACFRAVRLQPLEPDSSALVGRSCVSPASAPVVGSPSASSSAFAPGGASVDDCDDDVPTPEFVGSWVPASPVTVEAPVEPPLAPVELPLAPVEPPRAPVEPPPVSVDPEPPSLPLPSPLWTDVPASWSGEGAPASELTPPSAALLVSESGP